MADSNIPLQEFGLAGRSYHVQPSDHGKVLEVPNGSAIIFDGDIPVGFYTTFVNVGGGVVPFSTTTGKAIVNSAASTSMTQENQVATALKLPSGNILITGLV